MSDNDKGWSVRWRIRRGVERPVIERETDKYNTGYPTRLEAALAAAGSHTKRVEAARRNLEAAEANLVILTALVKRERAALPICAQAMGCLCACHAAGLDAVEPCDTDEERAREIAQSGQIS